MNALRPLVAPLSAPLIRWLAATPLTPNQLTLLGLVLNGAVAAVLAFGNVRLGGVLVLLASAFDLLDGALARATGRVSRFGAFLDSTLDRVAEGLLFLGLAGRGARHGESGLPLWAFLASATSLLVSYSRARAEGLGVRGEAGLFDRPARVVTLAVGLLLGQGRLALVLITLGAALTVLQRIVAVRQQLPD
ncbi:MAG: CDP-alcohol phosphatidyltransferase family protein [Chloroflexi bacterium]|nr:CDP-alcohol phosphatidyltransferase family protein [Chloroflexota bacterium]GIW11267.1 MAG: hypothetical protein KatS3mg061_2324 [Dehalococcoidia bacterium]